MKNLKVGIVASVIGGLVAGQIVSAQQAPAKPPKADVKAKTDVTASARGTLQDIEATLGFVPQFFRQVADSQLESFWASMKTFQMNPNTALDGKTKELIGLGVAAQIPCDYCIYFHTEAAKKNGATEQEIREAIGMAAMTRLGSTVLNGNQIDAAQFKKEVARLFKDTGKKVPSTATR